MFKIKILLILFIPSILFSQGKSDFLGKWKVDNISFQIGKISTLALSKFKKKLVDAALKQI